MCACSAVWSSDKQNLFLSLNFFSIYLSVGYRAPRVLCVFHSIRKNRNMPSMGEVLGHEFVLETSIEHMSTIKWGVWVYSFFFFPLQRLIIRVIFYMGFWYLGANVLPVINIRSLLQNMWLCLCKDLTSKKLQTMSSALETGQLFCWKYI